MMVKASHLGEENNGTVRRLLAEMKQRFPRGSEQLILEVIYEVVVASFPLLKLPKCCKQLYTGLQCLECLLFCLCSILFWIG